MSKCEDGTYIVLSNGGKKVLRGIRKKYGYFVSLKGHEVKRRNGVTEHQVIKYNQRRFVKGTYVGVWTDEDGVTYLDRSVYTKSLQTAMQLGVQNEQLAIWDCRNNEAISVVNLG